MQQEIKKLKKENKENMEKQEDLMNSAKVLQGRINTQNKVILKMSFKLKLHIIYACT